MFCNEPGHLALECGTSYINGKENACRIAGRGALGADGGQRVYNAGHEAIQPSEHQTIEIAENKSFRRSAPQHIDLLPEKQDFRLKPRP
jgi:hypothetical protein